MKHKKNLEFSQSLVLVLFQNCIHILMKWNQRCYFYKGAEFSLLSGGILGPFWPKFFWKELATLVICIHRWTAISGYIPLWLAISDYILYTFGLDSHLTSLESHLRLFSPLAGYLRLYTLLDSHLRIHLWSAISDYIHNWAEQPFQVIFNSGRLSQFLYSLEWPYQEYSPSAGHLRLYTPLDSHFRYVRSLSVSFFIEKEPRKQLRMKRKRKGER